jgi:hypothetical protein
MLQLRGRGTVAACVGASVRANLRAIATQITLGGREPSRFVPAEALLLMPHALALPPVSDLIAVDGPFI